MRERRIYGSNQFCFTMGRAKEMMIEMEQDPFYGVSDRLVSAHLFENKLVRAFVLKNGFDGVCSYCNDETKVLPLKSIVKEIDRIILQYFGEPDNEGVGWDSGFEGDAPGFHLEGGGYIVPNNKPYYDDMHELLFCTGFEVKDNYLEKDIADALSFHDALIEQDPYGLNEAEERWVDWRIMKQSAIQMAKEGRTLQEIEKKEADRLCNIRNDIYVVKLPLQVEKGLTLYRVVKYDTERNSVTFSDLTSAPVPCTRDDRMSVKGDSVFYGAINKATAMREAQSSSRDKFAYVGTFAPRHPLRLLDLTVIPQNVSIFDYEQYHLFTFLQAFSQEISEPVSESDKIQYVPTQLLTYYFRNKLRHYYKDGSNYPIDGILYKSSKDGSTDAVLFYDNASSADHLELKEWDVMHIDN